MKINIQGEPAELDGLIPHEVLPIVKGLPGAAAPSAASTPLPAPSNLSMPRIPSSIMGAVGSAVPVGNIAPARSIMGTVGMPATMSSVPAADIAVPGGMRLPDEPRTLLGKIGHGIERVGKTAGEIAGSAFIPTVMPYIPGTIQSAMREEHEAERKGLAQAEEQQREAQAGLAGAEAERSGASAAEAKAEIAAGEPEARAELEKAQAGEASGRGELTEEQAKAYENAIAALKDPEIKSAFDTLADPKATTDQRRSAMATISQSPAGVLPMLREEMTGAENLYREGEIGSRIRGHNIIPDSSSPTGYSTEEYDAQGNVMGRLPVEPSSEGQLLLGPQAGNLVGRESQLAGARGAATQAQKLVPIVNPDTNRIIGYVPQGSIASMTKPTPEQIKNATKGGLFPKPTTTTTNQAQMAASMRDMIENNIFPVIDDAAKAGAMGPVSGRVQAFLLKKIGDPKSPAGYLQATLDAIPMMLGRMYGYRSAEYARELGNFMNIRMTPEALHAYLDGVLAHAGTIERQGGMEFQNPTAQSEKGHSVEGHAGGKNESDSGMTFEELKRKAGIK